jgi:O-antigen/teichoic acid export membrane protein
VSPTITAFFTWQIIVSALSLIIFTASLWRSLSPADRPPVFNPNLLRNIWRFAAGMSGIALSAIILTQLDKVILSKLLTLEMFGYYTIAGAASSVIPTLLGGPVFNAIFPRFTSLIALNDDIGLKLLYHQSSQLMAVLVLPVAAVLSFFSFDILFLWTGSVKIAAAASPIVSLLVIGMALNCLMAMPYALQLSHGWTSIGLRINTFLIITLVPAIYFMTTRYGVMGAAAAWVILNSIYMLIGVPLTHRRLLKGEMGRWFIKDIILPFGAALLIGGAGRWLIASPMPPATAIISLTVILLSTLTASALVAPHIRIWLLIQLRMRIIHV